MEEIIKEFRSEQGELISLLHRIQEKFGYIPSEALRKLSQHLKISESEIFGVLTFYNAFSLKPRGKHLVTICLGTACHVRGATRILDEFVRKLKINPGETTPDHSITLETVNCVGACALGPVVITDGVYHGQMKTTDVEQVVAGIIASEEGNPSQ